MRVHTVVAACMIVLLPVCAPAQAQECDFVAVGQSMTDAAGQGDWSAVFTGVEQILAAAPDDVTTLSAEEQYWIGIAHMYRMAQVLDAVKNDLQDEEQAAYAASVSQWVLNPYENVTVVGYGERVDLAEHLVAGQTVIVDFFSEYCPPCVAIAPRLEQLANERDDIVLLKVDINRPGVQGIDWQSPTAQQFGLRSIPHFRVYGPDGEMLAEGQEARAMIVAWLEELGG